MNRQERRKLKKQMKGQNVIVNPGVEQIDRTNARYCWRHNLKLDNIDKPSDRDKLLIQSITLKPFKIVDKNGHITMGRSCPRCYNTIYVKSPLLDPSKESIIITPEENDVTSIPMSNLSK